VALAPGTRLGAYEILTLIGVGGMGEVYRATDTKLHRDVAIKVLPSEVAADPDRLARFEREAQVLASLNHPNIAHIHGVDESAGVPALIMELVEGPTLADRIAKGPIPLDEALPIAKQIAEALEAAHEQGIIHRDLKPANIKVRPDGTVKVLDFGLAKAFDPLASAVGNATMSPTLSIHATQVGLILGTAAYMAPEQARGKSVDKRADIWAFGTVLFEMLSGQRPFDGDDVSVTLASVLKSDPDWQGLPAGLPTILRRLVRRCLQKEPKDRLQAIGDARIEIAELIGGVPESVSPTAVAPASPLWRRAITFAAVALAAASLGRVSVWLVPRSTGARPRPSRLTITPPSTATLSPSGITRDVALTSDGARLVYVGANGTTLFVRPLDQLDATPLVRSGATRDPFVSPDNQWVGFFDGPQTLRKVALTGGPAILVTRLESYEQGATWAPDGTIIFATASTTTGLQRVSADGGTRTVLTRPDRARGEVGHVWPEMLPGGQAVLYTVTTATGGLDAASIAVLNLRSGQSTIVLRGGSHAQYLSSGHLVYAASGTLRAAAFDLTNLVAAGPATPVVPHVFATPMGAVDAALARDGTLAYVSGSGEVQSTRTLAWVDRRGRETPLAALARAYLFPHLSPDGTRVAVTALAQKGEIWLWDLAHENLTRLSAEQAAATNPVWMPDGRRVVFASDRAGGALNLFRQAADGTGAAERLTESANAQLPSAVSPDATQLVFTELSTKSGADVMALQLTGQHRIVPLVQTPQDERNGIVSPDGRWLAYEANDSGMFDVYVRPFPEVNTGRWQISTNGGVQPLWAPGGHELFYFAPDGALMRVAVTTGPTWTAGAPTKALDGRYVVSTGGNFPTNYDIAPDGQRFLVIKAPAADATGAPPQIIVVQHFDEELKRLVPTK
jgi:serine/threonine-protein kinase